MQIKIKASNLELTEAIRAYFQEKMDMLEKYLGDIPVMNCDCEIEKAVGGQHKGEIFRAEVNLNVPRQVLRVEKTEKDLYKAIDKVKDHLELVIKKYKEKIRDKRRGK
ncbi:MAG: ribosome-associated translation inhibitor RaiA [Patescibacteria group bacterium]|jgi:putative sigma-54 modulation protein